VRFVVGVSLMIRASEDAYENLEAGAWRPSRDCSPECPHLRLSYDRHGSAEWLKSASSTGWEWTETNGWVSATQLRHAPPFGHLFSYLLASNFLSRCESLLARESEEVHRCEMSCLALYP